ncbi:hypothetical protein bsdtb5_16690 [Anaeromicropila herbilytica]|uniref:Uncharacterized protein n=1 Tax=Anaeromicropila herbilytica TaxID=2785025 RepID=A0A7R7EKF8_9FIRM|nr:hypothetical protein bsdtb5_16690 [Anaeromicropila herbilytica]
MKSNGVVIKTEEEARINNLALLSNGLPTHLQEEMGDNAIKKGKCYIVTAVYGSYDYPQVWTLRRFRDFYLAKSWYG